MRSSGIFAGFYYWWPKIFGKMLNETLGKWNFWLMVIGMNLTFGPMHILGLQGQPRRMVVYPEKLTGEGFFNLHFWNTVASVGSYLLAIGIFLFLVNVWHTTRKGAKAPLDPWDARSLEWLTDNPPKVHNFDVIPHVHALDEYFHLKYEEVDTDAGPRLVKVKTAEELHAEQEANADQHIHMPSPSYWPMVVAIALPIMAYGIIFSKVLAVAGGAILLLGIFAWSLEPSVADDSDYDPPPGWATEQGACQCLRQPSPSHTPSCVAHVADDHGAHVSPSTGLSNNKLAMWLFLGSECLLFGGLISTYMLYRGRHTGSPGPAQLWDIPLTSVSSFVLLMSSLTMVLAVSAAQQRDDRLTCIWLSVTALLGSTFVGAQVYEFTSFYHEGVGFTTSLFSSSFFTLTGFHGIHVTVGIIMLMSLVGIISRSKVPGDKAEVVELIGLYWHFVDIVWIVIFTLVYLIPA